VNDPLTLALDASTYSGTAALVRGSAVLMELDVPMRTPDRESLLPAIASLLDRAHVTPREIERVVCGAGPGSFTSLRIAAAIAKGVALGAAAPLFAVSSLLLIIAGNDIAAEPGRYVAILDALRGDVFAAAFEVRPPASVIELCPATLMPRVDAQALALRLSACVVGPDQESRLMPHARGVARLHNTLDNAAPEDLALWEPSYGRLAEAQARWEREHGRPLAGT
jgi:tRNA threonylcarbamoyladenosine biosynthesis protein TsaB